MQLSLALSIFGCILAAADAKWFKRSGETQSWTPAKETGAIPELDPMGMTPRPTPAPGAKLLEKELRKRIGTSTCGYYAQYSSSAALWCVDSNAYCIVNDLNMAVGCCDSPNMADCTIPTSCIDSTEAPAFSADFNDAYTLFCTEVDYPNCVTYSYDSYDPLYPFYSALGCGVESALYSVEYYPPELGSAIDAGITTVSSSMPVMSSSAPPPSSMSTTSTTTSSSTTSLQTSGTPQPTPGPKKKTAVAPIVGGAVGGVAGLALIGLSIFFIIRSTRNTGSRPAAPPLMMTTNTQYPGPNGGHSTWATTSPPVSQAPQHFGGYPPAGFTAMDQRASTIAPSSYFPQSPKSQFEVVQVAAVPVSPSTSPVPTSPSTQSPVPGFQAGLSGPVSPSEETHQARYSVHNQDIATRQQQYQVHNSQHGQAVELPLTKSDGELRELE